MSVLTLTTRATPASTGEAWAAISAEISEAGPEVSVATLGSRPVLAIIQGMQVTAVTLMAAGIVDKGDHNARGLGGLCATSCETRKAASLRMN